jgi:hypothetical protein
MKSCHIWSITVVLLGCTASADALSLPKMPVVVVPSRRNMFRHFLTMAAATTTLVRAPPPLAWGKETTDCLVDCTKNCNAVAPKNAAYCQESCVEYCLQPDDRTDGRSGSTSRETEKG